MKKKWLVSWWSDAQDKQVNRGFDTYEEAITFKEQIKRKSNRRAMIQLRDGK